MRKETNEMLFNCQIDAVTDYGIYYDFLENFMLQNDFDSKKMQLAELYEISKINYLIDFKFDELADKNGINTDFYFSIYNLKTQKIEWAAWKFYPKIKDSDEIGPLKVSTDYIAFKKTLKLLRKANGCK